jgi:mannose-6-phosphate isomerase-like protein (cupin superfamily)
MFDPDRYVTDAAQLPKEDFEWGTLQWLSNGRLFRGAEQTFGICSLRPGCGNPRHYHPNCEEVLHVLSGHGIHSFEEGQVELQSGMTIRIPLGVTHNLTNTGTEPMVCAISFNSGNRETVFLE